MLDLIKRKNELFIKDVLDREGELNFIVQNSRFLVLGGAGSIGLAVSKEIFKRNPLKLHIVDISENNLVELVRDLRSSIGYSNGEFKTFALDVGSKEYDMFIKNDGIYDYVLNLSALKHVRSEKDPFTLMRMINVNILNTFKTLQQSIDSGVKKYFSVSSDKATDPINMMGASKRIMELILLNNSNKICVSTARFANVAFSDGSLLYSFKKRIEKKQPLVAPNDIKRYFVTPEEAGKLCLLSCIFGENRDVYFPIMNKNIHLVKFSDIAIKFLNSQQLKAKLCSNEKNARDYLKNNLIENTWPCYFSKSDTTGEKDIEEFYSKNDNIVFDKYDEIGIIKNIYNKRDTELLSDFKKNINSLYESSVWDKSAIVDLFKTVLPNFKHLEKNRSLDSKM